MTFTIHTHIIRILNTIPLFYHLILLLTVLEGTLQASHKSISTHLNKVTCKYRINVLYSQQIRAICASSLPLLLLVFYI